jgi:hypothetical protein
MPSDPVGDGSSPLSGQGLSYHSADRKGIYSLVEIEHYYSVGKSKIFKSVIPLFD